MKSDAINELATALSLVQGELQDVNRAKQGHGYKYADLGQVLAEVRPALARHGLAIIQMPGRMVDGEITLETLLIHSSGQWVSATCSAPIVEGRGMSAAQAVGSVISYLRRYCLAAMVGLTQIDDDAALHQTPVAGPRTPAVKTTATQVAAEPNTDSRPISVLSRETQRKIWSAASSVWTAGEALNRITSLLGELGLPLRSADLTEEQGLQLLGAIEAVEVGP